jgi:hypothetical protein
MNAGFMNRAKFIPALEMLKTLRKSGAMKKSKLAGFH